MAKYLYVYHGGKMPATEQEKIQAMDAWGRWYGSLGNAIVDGGNPVGQSYTVRSDASVVEDGGPNPASGYSLVEAADLATALEMAKRCPILASGGSVEVAQAIDM